MYVYVCTYECHHRYVAACRDQKRQFGLLELELKVVRSLCVMLRTKHRSSLRAVSALIH